MTRTRQSAKQAGSRFERQIADYLAAVLGDDRIDRRVKTGSKDRGDIGGLRVRGERLVVECKNTARVDLAGWIREAQDEAGNDDAAAGVVVHKRRGSGQPGEQWVHLTLADFVRLVWGVETPESGVGV